MQNRNVNQNRRESRQAKMLDKERAHILISHLSLKKNVKDKKNIKYKEAKTTKKCNDSISNIFIFYFTMKMNTTE